MINISLNIRNPYSNQFKNIWSKGFKTPFKNKFFEAQIYKGSDLVDFFLRVTTRQDHAGAHFGIGLFGYNLELQFYDSRHWNDEEGRWYQYSDDGSCH